MSRRLQLNPKLPKDTHPRLVECLNETALVTREIQAPPHLHMEKQTTAQSLLATTATKITFNNARRDTHGWWDTTNYRYQPQRAGYYQLIWSLEFDDSGSAPSEVRAMLYNNLGLDKTAKLHNPHATLGCVVSGSSIAYSDGSSRYWEIWAYSQHAVDVLAVVNTSYFCAVYLGDNALR